MTHLYVCHGAGGGGEVRTSVFVHVHTRAMIHACVSQRTRVCVRE